jgi:hypothetical protein
VADTLIEVGERTTMGARGLDAAGRPVSIGVTAVSSGTPSLATVTPDGLVTGVAPGRAVLVAETGGVRGERTIVVRPTSVQAVRVAPVALTLVPGRSQPLDVVTLDRRGQPLPDRERRYRSSDEAVAAVSSDGVVRAVAPGRCTIEVRSEGAVATVALVVPADEGPVALLSLEPAGAVLRVGERVPLGIRLSDSLSRPATGRLVVWRSLAPAVAVVNAVGLVEAVGLGTAVIEATSEGVTGRTAVTVVSANDSALAMVVVLPPPEEFVIDTLRPVVDVRGPDVVDSVVVSFGVRTWSLALLPFGPRGTPLWQGPFDIQDLPFGRIVFAVTAWDRRGRRTSAPMAIVRRDREDKGGGPPRPPSK